MLIIQTTSSDKYSKLFCYFGGAFNGLRLQFLPSQPSQRRAGMVATTILLPSAVALPARPASTVRDFRLRPMPFSIFIKYFVILSTIYATHKIFYYGKKITLTLPL